MKIVLEEIVTGHERGDSCSDGGVDSGEARVGKEQSCRQAIEATLPICDHPAEGRLVDRLG